ncbi:MAG: tetratricopeptide repeat protein [Roseobacter sp.]
MRGQIFIKVLAISGLCLTLAACESAEDKADAYFESAQELIAAGDPERAIIELRNVFELIPNHADARRSMAQLMMEQGNRAAAYGQYLRLVEQLPDDAEGRTALAELAFEGRNWEEFERHGQRAVELDPDRPSSQVIELALQYRQAVLDSDTPAIEGVSIRAETMMDTFADSSILEQILFDTYLRAGAPAADKALAQLEKMISRAPQTRHYYEQRLLLLRETGDREKIEAHLRDVVDTFPEDLEAKSRLVQYFIATGEQEKAETFLREISDPTDADPTLFVSLVQFVKQTRGNDAARAEIDAALDVNPEPDRLRVIRAALDFEDGERDVAISALQEIIDRAEPSELLNEIKVALSRMLQATGNEVGAQRLIGEVLEADGDNVAALKINAAQLIEADEADSAIANLRRALDSQPEDEQALNLMADAYLRSGSRDLARDFIAQAVDVSDHAPASSLRYARLLMSEDNSRAAEEVLISALRRTPRSQEILTLLGEIYLNTDDFGRAEMVVEQLRRVETEASEAAANQLQIQLLARQDGNTEALAFLEQMAQGADAGLNEQVALLRARLASGQLDQALRLSEELVAEAPDDLDRRFLLAMTRAATGDLATAQASMRELATEDPTNVTVWQQLYRITQAENGDTASSAVLDEALQAIPDSPVLLWIKAVELEQSGQIDDAIAIYEGLYARDTGLVIFANNLASLLVTYKDDEASLDRAWTIARRLRDTEVPAFQDTYGWLAFRRGDVETALPYLENAATGLPQDPIVQYHLAETYAALERPQDAIAAYQRVLEMADTQDNRFQVDRARQQLAQLQQVSPETEKQ